MLYLALATDYDGTLATDGRVTKSTITALRRFRESGRKLILVTGRELDDLLRVFPHHELFDWIVAENGALLYNPAKKEEKSLAQKPNKKLIEYLENRKVRPLSVGRTIIATREPHEAEVLKGIRDLGLELQVIFNKGAVMVLPAGVNKEFGLRAALKELGLSSHNVVSVGDAENDHALLLSCGFAVAVGNALSSLKKEANYVTEGEEGEGVVELMDLILNDKLIGLKVVNKRHQILLGRDSQDEKVYFAAHGPAMLIAGPSGSGKTSATISVLEHVAEKGFQFLVIDPEGDYARFPDSVVLGDPTHIPRIEEVIQLLERFENPVVNLLGLPLADRPGFFSKLLTQVQDLRVKTGRPHWIVLDEAHHLLPVEWHRAGAAVPAFLNGVMMITVHPDKVAKEALKKVGIALAVGDAPEQTLKLFAEAIGERSPYAVKAGKKKLDVVAWFRVDGEKPKMLRLEPGKVEHDRHQRKYAHGDLEEDAFFFTGPNGKMRLRVHNLNLFIQVAEGIDDETWEHHLKRGDYSNWVRKAIGDESLADKIGKVEKSDCSLSESRKRIIEEVAKAYTAAA